MDRKKALILLSVVAMVAIMSSFALSAYATEGVDDDSTMPNLLTPYSYYGVNFDLF